MKFNMNTIRFKLVVGGCLAVFIPLLITGFFSVKNSTNAVTTLSKENAKSVANGLALLIDQALSGEKGKASAIASSNLLKSVGKEVNTKGVEGAGDSRQLLRQQMKTTYQALGDNYLGIFVTTAEGKIYTGELANGNEYKGSDISTRSYFQEAKNSKKVAIGDMVRSKSTGALSVVFAAPILSDNGQFLGVFGMSMKAEALINLVTAQKSGKTGYAFMSNSSGIIIAHPTQKHILTLDLKTLAGMEAINQGMMAGKADVEEYVFKGVDKIAGFAPVRMTGWSVALTQNSEEFLTSAKTLRNMILLISLISLAVIALCIFIAGNAITGPIRTAVDGLKDIAQGEGDLTMRLAVSSKDEAGELATWFNTFVEKLQNVIGSITTNIQDVEKSSGSLSGIAEALSKNAQDTSERANNVATAAEEMNVNLNSVAAAMEQSTTNTSMVASAAEEMTATISEIAANAQQAHSISETAVEQAKSTSNRMTELGQAAQAISKVTETITEISEQTNLLALNATIEAARAGEAGKGFAVVANEIKELAKQTAEATMDIKTQIEEVQGTTNSTVEEIGQISQVINNINEIVATISTAVGEQSAATEEIANNIAQASTGLGEVNENVSQSTVVSDSIAQDITGVNSASNEISNDSANVEESAKDLEDLAKELSEAVSAFKI